MIRESIKQLSLDDAKAVYYQRMHAVQSAIAFSLSTGAVDASPKHLRVGVDSAMVQIGATGMILIEKGVCTELEYFQAMAEFASRELESREAEMPEGVRFA